MSDVDESLDRESVAFLRRSLTDLEAEWAAGDLDDEDHARLRDEYTTRLARALRGEGDGDAAPPADADTAAAGRGCAPRWKSSAAWPPTPSSRAPPSSCSPIAA